MAVIGTNAGRECSSVVTLVRNIAYWNTSTHNGQRSQVNTTHLSLNEKDTKACRRELTTYLSVLYAPRRVTAVTVVFRCDGRTVMSSPPWVSSLLSYHVTVHTSPCG